MQNQKIEQKIIELMERDYPRPPQKIELGGSYYYRCYWYSCNRDVNKWMDFCPACGQRILWEKTDE